MIAKLPRAELEVYQIIFKRSEKGTLLLYTLDNGCNVSFSYDAEAIIVEDHTSVEGTRLVMRRPQNGVSEHANIKNSERVFLNALVGDNMINLNCTTKDTFYGMQFNYNVFYRPISAEEAEEWISLEMGGFYIPFPE